MATLHLNQSPSPSSLKYSRKHTHHLHQFNRHFGSLNSHRHQPPRLTLTVRSYKVIVEHEGETTTLEVEPDETILSKALSYGMDVPHDCKLVVCMTCPVKLLSGTVDQSEGKLSDDVVERGYALVCAAYSRSDCQVRIIHEEELLQLQLATATPKTYH